MAFDTYEVRRYIEMATTRICKAQTPPICLTYSNVADGSDIKEAIRQKQNWARVSMRQSYGRQLSMGSTEYHRAGGFIYVQFFAPQGMGVQMIEKAANAVGNGIKTDKANYPRYLTIRSPYVSDVGEDPDLKAWYAVTLTFEFEYDYPIVNPA